MSQIPRVNDKQLKANKSNARVPPDFAHLRDSPPFMFQGRPPDFYRWLTRVKNWIYLTKPIGITRALIQI